MAQIEGMETPVLHHASIQVSDVARSREFYEDILGFVAIERPNFGFSGAWYGLGSGQLHLIQHDGLDSARHAINPSDPHFAVTVDLEVMRARLAAREIEVLDLGGDQLWVLDPDGNTVELRRDPKA
jgi:catechol 2,3-dioxygenase-like lactoylglutathione lyase family enzyme